MTRYRLSVSVYGYCTIVYGPYTAAIITYPGPIPSLYCSYTDLMRIQYGYVTLNAKLRFAVKSHLANLPPFTIGCIWDFKESPLDPQTVGHARWLAFSAPAGHPQYVNKDNPL